MVEPCQNISAYFKAHGWGTDSCPDLKTLKLAFFLWSLTPVLTPGLFRKAALISSGSFNKSSASGPGAFYAHWCL